LLSQSSFGGLTAPGRSSVRIPALKSISFSVIYFASQESIMIWAIPARIFSPTSPARR